MQFILQDTHLYRGTKFFKNLRQLLFKIIKTYLKHNNTA